MTPIIRADHLRHVYSAGTPFEKVAIDDIDLAIPAGQFVGIIGHTGSGKSTILSVVTAIFATLTILLRRKGKSFEGMLCKFISSFGFMSMAFIGFCYRIEEADKLVHPFYFCLVAFGLLFGLGGDVLLGIKEIAPKYKNKLIALGTLAFLIGHFFYLASFYKAEPTFSIIPYIAAFVITAIIAIVMKAVKMKLDSKMYILCVFYFFVIALCACVSGYMLYLTHSLTFIITTIASVV